MQDPDQADRISGSPDHYEAVGHKGKTIERIGQAIISMYSDMQGIVGTTLQGLEGLGLPVLEGLYLGIDIEVETLYPGDTL